MRQMGTVYDTIMTNGKLLYALFDSGAVHNYITKKAAQELFAGPPFKPFEVGLGGSVRKVSQVCVIIGEIQGNHLSFSAYVVDEIGNDERGREIDLILGAREMQVWDIRINPEEEKLDLTHFRREFIEY